MAEKKPKVEGKLTETEAKEQSLTRTLGDLEKAYGKGAVMKLGDTGKEKVPCITTGCLGLDLALGIGGVPRGRIIEVYGPESSGKTTIALHIVAEAQKQGGIAAYVDAEHALDPIYAQNIGVNINDLYISQPDNGEQALEITEAMVRSGAIDIVIVDSVAALVPKSEIDGSMGDSTMGVHARLMSQALRKLTGISNRFDCTILFINQLRDKIGVIYGSNETTTGGRALKFYASVRIDIRRKEYLKDGTDFIGNRTHAKIVKNKMAPPFKLAEFDIMYGEGISKTGDVLDLAVDLDIIKRAGAWYSYGEERIGQGRDNAKKYLSENPILCNEVDNKVRSHYNLESVPYIEPAKSDENTSKNTSDENSEATSPETSEKKSAKKTKKSSKAKTKEEVIEVEVVEGETVEEIELVDPEIVESSETPEEPIEDFPEETEEASDDDFGEDFEENFDDFADDGLGDITSLADIELEEYEDVDIILKDE